jgi:hypothetical protein
VLGSDPRIATSRRRRWLVAGAQAFDQLAAIGAGLDMRERIRQARRRERPRDERECIAIVETS